VGQPAADPIAVVDPAHCNGCRRCVDDCPYEAITMAPHPLRKGRGLAQVDPDRCASCGICVGACPSSTPFRSSATLATGIDLPSTPIDALRGRVGAGLAALGDVPRKIVAFGCDHGVDTSRLRGADVAAFSLACTAQLPPAFIEHTLRSGAAGVLVSGCVEGGCEFRLGQRWSDARLRATREPHLRASVPRERVALAWAGRAGTAEAARVLQGLRERLAADERAPGPAAEAGRA
jgi:ferredoxin/coenzyme F420-reducing hydrogenase delta subunit